ncbi:MAG: hypothetical protein JOZ38_04640 [Candidatus Eremiobacteraeota bacterium]|nr:hypothetical protein [Candidatus Eremiobacteraeota bacterium]
MGAIALPCGPAAAQSLPDCWDLTYAAIHHRAVSPHPPFVTYDERISITTDGQPLIDTREEVAYRDDGVARIADERFLYEPYVTTRTEPGPPELGPYGNRRALWIPLDEFEDPALKLIASVHASTPNQMSCANAGLEQYKDHSTYHIAFSGGKPGAPALRDLWIDSVSHDIWKVTVSSFLPVAVDDGPSPRFANFEIELQQIGGYFVIAHVTWKYRYRISWQSSSLFGEYYYSNFGFPTSMPETLFTES